VVKVESLRLAPCRAEAENGSARAAAVRALNGAGTPGDGIAGPVDGSALLALLAAGDPPAFATDSRDRIVFWNRGMAELLGQTSHSALGRHCYETLLGRDVFGNRFCYPNCSVVASLRAGEAVCAFELKVATNGPDRKAVGLTILKIPGARPDIFTLVHIVRPVGREGWVAPAVTDHRPASTAPAPVTRREREILRYLAAGLQNKEVAQRLGLSLATVRNHVHNILDKLGVHSKLEAVSLSFRNGWVAPDELPTLVKSEPAATEDPGA
jgi:DNA-binding CsgD family transcriptional regulator